MRLFFSLFSLALCLAPTAAHAQNPTSLTVEDFETGVAAWTRNDKNKAGVGVASLVDIVPSRPTFPIHDEKGNLSQGSALVTFKAGQNSWASLSRAINGADWASIGAKTMTFWLDAGGETQGVILTLRGRYRRPDGTTFEVPFSLPGPIRLDKKQWRKVAIPISDFVGPNKEPLAPRLSGIYLIQFSQAGTWNSRFFSLDDIRVEGTGVPLNAPTLTTPPQPAATPAPTAAPGADDAAISADFLKTAGRVTATGSVSIGASLAGSGPTGFETSPQFRQSLAILKPRFVRLDAGGLADLVDSSRNGFNFSRLQSAVVRVKTLGAEPLVALSNPPQWGLDDAGYVAFAVGAARALNRKGAPPVRYFELATSSDSTEDASALALYNAAFVGLKNLSKNFRVGGFSALASDSAAQNTLLKGARGLDFLSVSFFGAPLGTPDDAALLAAARDIGALKTAAGLLDKSKFSRAALYVTQAGVAAAKIPGGDTPADMRLSGALSGAWWGQFLMSGSRLADQIFHNDAANPEWGLLNADAAAFPAFRAIWLWNTFFPVGAVRVSAASTNPALAVSAANTPTSHNLLMVNTSASAQTAQIAIRGFPVLREARLRIMDDPVGNVRFEKLPKSPFQTLTLNPYAVAVVQFIEPPKTTSKVNLKAKKR